MKLLLSVITFLLFLININAQNNPIEQKIKSFILSRHNTYGWETKSDDIHLDFLKDGRLHVQGPDGEATMWEGKWSLKGDKITMYRPDLEKTITVKVRIEGDILYLNEIKYIRIKPNFKYD
jgi:hypothetical protein